MPLYFSYTPNYFEIDDILATQERTQCKFLMNVPKLGKLNPAAEEADLKTGTSVELPMWLVRPLASGRQPVITASLPKIYKEGYREILKADPCAVDLHKFGLYFYELGAQAMYFDVRKDLGEVLIYTFKTRFRQIMDLADNVVSDPTVQNRLDKLEKRLFKDSHKARTKLNTWLVVSGAPIEAASMVVNHKKRKHVHLEDII